MRYLAVIALILAAASLSSCGGCPCGKKNTDLTRSGNAGSGTTTAVAEGGSTSGSSADTVTVEVDITERGYALLEPVVMSLKVTNNRKEDLILTFPTAQRYDFIVEKGKQIVWIWSEGRMFAQAIGRETIGAGETVSYEIVWDQSGLENIRPPLGAYTVQGILKTMPEIASEKHEFGIVD
jgi:hypothetical protein